jgi:3-oxoadipate CoA-transferase beta subunit
MTSQAALSALVGKFRIARQQIARWVAADIPAGSYVNLGIGMPTLVADFVDPGADVMFHSENGILGVGPRPPVGTEDPDLINASKTPVSVVPGASYMSHSDSFALIRGGHLDIAMLGAYQVSVDGDIANWVTASDAIPGIGGAMDLAVGAREVWVMMSIATREGEAKLLASCTYPLTATGVVTRVYTDLGVFHLTTHGPHLVRAVPGVSAQDLSAAIALDVR